MKECRKSIMWRLNEPNFITWYFRDEGVGIGGIPLFANLEAQKVMSGRPVS
jgi:hypothetical protein